MLLLTHKNNPLGISSQYSGTVHFSPHSPSFNYNKFLSIFSNYYFYLLLIQHHYYVQGILESARRWGLAPRSLQSEMWEPRNNLGRRGRCRRRIYVNFSSLWLAVVLAGNGETEGFCERVHTKDGFWRGIGRKWKGCDNIGVLGGSWGVRSIQS